ncbi:peripheral-type benzodiazepine receptor-associated protein 1-like [Oncorhynchus clarkii lewisi]|uniref:peripheral-type benzodiazepine receptor-associated protein 1-like n=1 Tax=Oncorhynchus clarkii lewisi TaxID=490388 RepID=UPI0039B95B05
MTSQPGKAQYHGKRRRVNEKETDSLLVTPLHHHGQGLRKEVVPLHFPDVAPQCQRGERLCLLEDNNRALKLKPGAFNQHKLQHILLETESSRKREECEDLDEAVKKNNQTCQTLENELQDVLQEKKHLSLHLFNNSQNTVQYEQVKSEYAQLKETLGAVTQERDSALREKTQLQGKLENLEQVLKCRCGRKLNQKL